MVIRRLFNRKISKFSALISLSALAAMFMLFFLFIPRFVATTVGQIFVGIWALMAVLSFVAYGRSVTSKGGRQYVPVYAIRKDLANAKSPDVGSRFSRAYLHSEGIILSNNLKKVERTSKARSTSSMRGR